MAIMRRGIIGDISGRLGGIEIALNRGRSIVKPAKQGRPKQTAKSYDAHTYHTDAIHHWNNLTDAQKLAWRNAALQRPKPDRLGIPRTPTGRELFLSVPHYVKADTSIYWQDLPPNNNAIITIQPSIYALSPSAFSISADFAACMSYHLKWAYISRFQNPGSQHHRHWVKIGPVLQDPPEPIIVFTSALADADIALIDGETWAIQFGWFCANYWPLNFYLGTATITAP
jgi:hypothetical protein